MNDVIVTHGGSAMQPYWEGTVDGIPFRFKYTNNPATAAALRDKALHQAAAWQAIYDRLTESEES